MSELKIDWSKWIDPDSDQPLTRRVWWAPKMRRLIASNGRSMLSVPSLTQPDGVQALESAGEERFAPHLVPVAPTVLLKMSDLETALPDTLQLGPIAMSTDSLVQATIALAVVGLKDAEFKLSVSGGGKGVLLHCPQATVWMGLAKAAAHDHAPAEDHFRLPKTRDVDHLFSSIIASAERASPGDDRSGRAGSGDVASIMGLSPWKSSWAVANEKLSGQEPEKSNAALSFGRWMEATVLARWRYENPEGTVEDPGMLRHPNQPWATSTEDLIWRVDGKVILIDAKTSSEVWYGVPAHIRASSHWQYMIATKALPDEHIEPYVLIPTLNRGFKGGDWFHEWRVDIDTDYCREVWTAVSRWWTNLQKGTLPPVDGSASTRQAAAQTESNGEVMEATPEISDLVLKVLKWDKRCELAEETKDTLRNRLAVSMGEVYRATGDGFHVDYEEHRGKDWYSIAQVLLENAELVKQAGFDDRAALIAEHTPNPKWHKIAKALGANRKANEKLIESYEGRPSRVLKVHKD